MSAVGGIKATMGRLKSTFLTGLIACFVVACGPPRDTTEALTEAPDAADPGQPAFENVLAEPVESEDFHYDPDLARLFAGPEFAAIIEIANPTGPLVVSALIPPFGPEKTQVSDRLEFV